MHLDNGDFMGDTHYFYLLEDVNVDLVIENNTSLLLNACISLGCSQDI